MAGRNKKEMIPAKNMEKFIEARDHLHAAIFLHNEAWPPATVDALAETAHAILWDVQKVRGVEYTRKLIEKLFNSDTAPPPQIENVWDFRTRLRRVAESKAPASAAQQVLLKLFTAIMDYTTIMGNPTAQMTDFVVRNYSEILRGAEAAA